MVYGLSSAVVVGASVIDDSALTKDAKTIEITMDGSIVEYIPECFTTKYIFKSWGPGLYK